MNSSEFLIATYWLEHWTLNLTWFCTGDSEDDSDASESEEKSSSESETEKSSDESSGLSSEEEKVTLNTNILTQYW